jgi:hypothetical protein
MPSFILAAAMSLNISAFTFPGCQRHAAVEEMLPLIASRPLQRDVYEYAHIIIRRRR